jgi:nucleotide-binding universal stress UspA family protein
MNTPVYLLALDGSAESMAAAYFTWELAKKTRGRVVAQHVVDTTKIWDFLAFDLAGLIGSGVYLSARDRITDIMYSIADALMHSYNARVSGYDIAFDNFIDSGELAEEISKRAVGADLLVMGYKSRKARMRKIRLFEALVEKCSCPVLLTAGCQPSWRQELVLEMEGGGINLDGLSELKQVLDGDESAGQRKKEIASMKQIQNSAEESAILVVPRNVLRRGNGVCYSQQVKAFLDASPRRALLIVPDSAVVSKEKKIA